MKIKHNDTKDKKKDNWAKSTIKKTVIYTIIMLVLLFTIIYSCGKIYKHLHKDKDNSTEDLVNFTETIPLGNEQSSQSSDESIKFNVYSDFTISKGEKLPLSNPEGNKGIKFRYRIQVGVNYKTDGNGKKIGIEEEGETIYTSPDITSGKAKEWVVSDYVKDSNTNITIFPDVVDEEGNVHKGMWFSATVTYK